MIQRAYKMVCTAKRTSYTSHLPKLVGLQLHAAMEDYISIGKEKVELPTKALQKEGVLREIKSKF